MSQKTPIGGRFAARWRKAFLSCLRAVGNVSQACAAAAIDRRVVYRAKDRHADFAADWEDALADASDGLLAEARRRAVDGLPKPVVNKGEIALAWVAATGELVMPGTEGAELRPLVLREYSDSLLLALLKATRAEFRESVKHEHTGKDGRPIQHDLRLNDAERAAIVAGLAARYGQGDAGPDADEPPGPGGSPVGGPFPGDDVGRTGA